MTGQTTRVSVDSAGAQAMGGNSGAPAISANGRFVAFDSLATNLVASDGNGFSDVFVHDTMTHATTRVSLTDAGVEGDNISRQPAISADGRWVAFLSSSSNFINGILATNVFVRDRNGNGIFLASVSTSTQPANENCFDVAMRRRAGARRDRCVRTRPIGAQVFARRPRAARKPRTSASEGERLVPARPLPTVLMFWRGRSASRRRAVERRRHDLRDRSSRILDDADEAANVVFHGSRRRHGRRTNMTSDRG